MTRKGEQGVALVITLFLMGAMSALAVSMMFLAQTETSASRNYRTMSQARYAGEAGVHRALNYLSSTAYAPTVDLLTFAITPTGDGTNDVWVGGVSRPDNRHIKRVNRSGTIVSTFQEPNLDAEVYTIAPLKDGTRDFYIGGVFTTYNGAAVNHFARIHGDGTLASVVSGGS